MMKTFLHLLLGGVIGGALVAYLGTSGYFGKYSFVTQNVGIADTTNTDSRLSLGGDGGGDAGEGSNGEMLGLCDEYTLFTHNNANIKVNANKTITITSYGSYLLSCRNAQGWNTITDDPFNKRGVFSGTRRISNNFTIDPWTNSIICSNEKGEQCVFTINHKPNAKCGEVTPQPMLEGQTGTVLCRNQAKDCDAGNVFTPKTIDITPIVQRWGIKVSGTTSQLNFKTNIGGGYTATCSRECGAEKKSCNIPFDVTKPSCSATLSTSGTYTITKNNEGVNKLFCNLYKDGKAIQNNINNNGSLPTTEPGVYTVKCHKGSATGQEITCMSKDIIIRGSQCPVRMMVKYNKAPIGLMYDSNYLDDYKYIEGTKDFPIGFPRNTNRYNNISCRIGNVDGKVTAFPQTNPLDYTTIYHYTCTAGSTVCHGFAQYPKKDTPKTVTGTNNNIPGT